MGIQIDYLEEQFILIDVEHFQLNFIEFINYSPLMIQLMPILTFANQFLKNLIDPLQFIYLNQTK